MTPKWVIGAALAALVLGAGSFVLGPVLLHALAASRVPTDLIGEARNAALEQQLKLVVDRFYWIFPLGGGLGFCGMITLLLAWVSRPLGDDEEKRAADPAEGEQPSAGEQP